MSEILEKIEALYPSLAVSLFSLPPDEASDLRLMTELGAHAVDLFEAGDVQDVRPAFDLSERLISTGDSNQRDAAILGFLETIQNVASHRECGSAAFEMFLGPSSQSAWIELMSVWRGKNSLAEVIASETGATLRPRWWQFWRKQNRVLTSNLLNEVENPELRRIIEQITRE